MVLLILRETLPALFVSGLFSLVPGLFLASFALQLRRVRGLLTLVPALIGMRGNIFGSFCAHVSSSQHVQARLKREKTSKKNRENTLDQMRRDIQTRQGAALAEVLLLSFLLPVLASFTFEYFGRPVAQLGLLVFICVASGLTSGIILLLVSIGTVHTAHRQGVDPDNVAPPLITTMGDVITLPIIAGCAYMAQSLSSTALWAVNGTGLVVMLLLLGWTATRSPQILGNLFLQRTPVLVTCLVLSSLAGWATEEYLLDTTSPYLFFVPLINAQGGNAGAIFASRISSALVLSKKDKIISGQDLMRVILCRARVEELVGVTLSMTCVLVSIGALVNLIYGSYDWSILLLFFVLSVVACVVSSLATMGVTGLAVLLAIHPDNIVIAVVCAFMDLFGTYLYAILLIYSGFIHS